LGDSAEPAIAPRVRGLMTAKNPEEPEEANIETDQTWATKNANL